MKRKKTPAWLIMFLALFLAATCVGSCFLIAASVADPELYAAVTDPVKAYVSQQIQLLDASMKKLGETIQQTMEDSKDFLQEKSKEAQEQFHELVESFQKDEDPLEEAPDPQALAESELLIPRDLADPDTTHFITSSFNGQEMLTGGNFPLVYFNQVDPQWGNYGSDSIQGYGCGPTAMAMVVSTLTGLYIDPQEMADIFVEEGYWAKGGGTYYQFAEEGSKLFGLEVSSLVPEETSREELLLHLVSNEIAIALMSKGHFTNGGHFIVLRGVTLSGDVLVADPASRDRSLTTWDPQLILDELSAVRLMGAPLWFFSLPSSSGEVD